MYANQEICWDQSIAYDIPNVESINCFISYYFQVCACEEDFCNTFAYLRGSIEEENSDSVADLQPSNLIEVKERERTFFETVN